MIDKKQLTNILSGGDLRSIGKSQLAIPLIKNQQDFDELFKCLCVPERIIVMRAADAIEKITLNDASLLVKHKKSIIGLCKKATDKELKWHLALLLPRLPLTTTEIQNAWSLLKNWAKDDSNSRIVRVNALQGLLQLLNQNSGLKKDFIKILAELEKENIPSIKARIKKIRKESGLI
jgi:hypothetical protein